MFAPQNLTEQELLGSTPLPHELTMDALRQQPTDMLQVPTTDTLPLALEQAAKVLSGDVSLDQTWVNIVSDFVLSPYGLSQDYFAQSENQVPNDIQAATPRSSRPQTFVMLGSVQAPAHYRVNASSIVPFDMAPTSTGAPGFTTPDHKVSYLPAIGSSVRQGVCKLYRSVHKQWHSPLFRLFKRKAMHPNCKNSIKNRVAGLKSKLERAVHYVAQTLQVLHTQVDNACSTMHSNLDTLTLEVGGGTVASWAVGGEAPSMTPRDGPSVVIPKPEVPFTLGKAAAISSCAYAGAVNQFVGIQHAAPAVKLWPIQTNGNAANHMMGDGGDLENLGLLTMLRRGAQKAIVFDNGNTALAEVSDVDLCDNATWASATTAQVNSWASYSTVGLFGYGEDSLGTWFSNNQVFDRAELPELLCAAQRLLTEGKPTVVRGSHTLIDNSFWGVTGGPTIDVVWVMNNKCREFESLLPTETQVEIAKGSHGAFANFPYYKTMFQNHDTTSLTNAQAQLLAAQSEYIVMQNSDMIQEVLS
jgi:hypothetical protein